MPKDAYWFPHDSNARHDEDIVDMRSEYGYLGYGWYWAIVEMMREQEDYQLKLCKCNAHAMQMQCTTEEAQSFIKDCIEKFDLFKSDGTYFWSESLIRRMAKKEEKTEKARSAAITRWTSKRNADAMQTQCERNAIRKEKSIKEKSIKENKTKYAETVLMLETEYGKLVDQYGPVFTKRCIEVLDNYKGASGKTYKSDYKAILNWVVKRVEEETKKQPANTSQMPRAFRTIMEAANE